MRFEGEYRIGDGICFLLPVLTDVYFYDTWLFWALGQAVANVIFFICLLSEFLRGNRKDFRVFSGIVLLLIAFETDVAATALGFWKGGFVSKYVFIALFAASLVVFSESFREVSTLR